MRWYTCTPVEFGGGEDFFARDSGLLCRGFQTLGIDSRAVMPGARRDDDDDALIRTDFENLESVEWWQAHQIDGVVLYAWGRPKFRKVAAAIREAGIFLVLNQDSGGLVSPLSGFGAWLREQWILSGQGRGLIAILRFVQLTLRGLSVGIVLTDLLRAAHLRQGDVIASVSPKAAECYRMLCRIYGGEDLAGRVEVVPHAVEHRFQYFGEAKRRQVVCVGRWRDTVQKRPRLLMDVIGLLVASDDGVVVVIVGAETPEMMEWHQSLDDGQRGRVQVRGWVDRDELAAILLESEVFYSPSAYESFGIAAAEALCSGCSVVAGRSVSMASFDWFVSEDSGTLAAIDQSQWHVRSLSDELASWSKGERDAREISRVWCERLHAGRVAAQVREIAGRFGNSDLIL